MKHLHPLLMILVTFLIAYGEATFDGFRWLVGVQIDLLPVAMVYAALTGGPFSIAVTAVSGGLWFDALSANPPGVTILPLLVVGIFIHSNRLVLLRNEKFAQFVLGLAAGAAVPFLSVLLLLTLGFSPLVGWNSLGHLALMALAAACLTPPSFMLLDWVNRALTYPLAHPSTFRSDREIKRGRT